MQPVGRSLGGRLRRVVRHHHPQLIEAGEVLVPRLVREVEGTGVVQEQGRLAPPQRGLDAAPQAGPGHSGGGGHPAGRGRSWRGSPRPSGHGPCPAPPGPTAAARGRGGSRPPPPVLSRALPAAAQSQAARRDAARLPRRGPVTARPGRRRRARGRLPAGAGGAPPPPCASPRSAPRSGHRGRTADRAWTQRPRESRAEDGGGGRGVTGRNGGWHRPPIAAAALRLRRWVVARGFEPRRRGAAHGAGKLHSESCKARVRSVGTRTAAVMCAVSSSAAVTGVQRAASSFPHRNTTPCTVPSNCRVVVCPTSPFTFLQGCREKQAMRPSVI